MKLAIFGGTFDPFTKAHEAIVNTVLDEKIADEVIIAPTVTNWYRDKYVGTIAEKSKHIVLAGTAVSGGGTSSAKQHFLKERCETTSSSLGISLTHLLTS